MREVFHEAANLLGSDGSVVVATVVRTKGSTPQKPNPARSCWSGRTEAVSARWAAGLVDEIRDALADHADPIKAEGMRAYMKSEIPYRGVQTPLRRKILRTVSLMQPEHSDHLTFRQAEWRVYLLQHS